jgi:Winged helix-turn helix
VQPELNAELNAMSDDEFAAIIGAADQQMAQQLVRAQACLDLFEKDCGRRANTALDIRVWADVQVPENLQFRILRRLRTAEVWTEACKRIWNDIPAPLASRPPMGQRISLSLAEAAKTTGLSESTIAKQTLSRELRAMGYRKLSARPRHHAQAQGAIKDFKKASPCAWKNSRARRRSTATR